VFLPRDTGNFPLYPLARPLLRAHLMDVQSKPRGSQRGKPEERLSHLLGAFSLNEHFVGPHEMTELREVVSADYREAAGLPAPQMARELVDVTKHGIDPRRPAWRKWRTTEDYRVRLSQFGSDIAVHAEPYRRGSGLLLWGFSCDARIEDRGAFVIFLNTAHQPGAVAATVAHELGHYVYRSIAGETSDLMAPLEANFASHLNDRAELFADSLAAFSAYSLEAVKAAHHAGSCDQLEELVRAVRFIDPEYRIDFADRAVSPMWRIKYLAASIHFYKVRKALFETAAI
jgi:hypothetical protein